MDHTPDTKKKWVRWVSALILICILIFLAVKNIDTVSSILMWCVNLARPLIVGAAIALIFDVPMSFFENYLWSNSKSRFLCAVRRPTSFILSLVIIIGGIAGLVTVVIPEVVESVKIVVRGAIDMVSRLNAMNDEEVAELPFGSIINQVNWDEVIAKLQGWLKDQSSNIVKGALTTLSSLVTIIFNLVVSFAFGIYLLFSKDKVKGELTRAVRVWLPEKFGTRLIHAATVAKANFRNFISGQTLEGLILGLLCFFGMLLLGIPYAPMVSVLVGVTALIPVVGGFIGGGIGAFMILTSDPSKALIFLIFLIILQQLEGNLIYPKVMGHRIKLPGIWILAAVTLGGGIGGPVGMLISVPLTSTFYVLAKEATDKREEEKHKESDEAQSDDNSAPHGDDGLVREILAELDGGSEHEASKKKNVPAPRKKQKKSTVKKDKSRNSP